MTSTLPATVTLYRMDPGQNMQRYYRLDVQRDLFGAWCVIREWGRVGSAGQLRTLPCETEAQALRAFEKQLKRKQRRGYV